MSREDLETKVREVIARHVDLLVEEVQLDDDLVDDLGADSLMRVEIVLASEEAFEIDIPDEEADLVRTVRTVRDVVSLVERISGRKAA